MSLKTQLRTLRRRFLVEVARQRAARPSSAGPIDIAQAQRILILRADGIGDYILMSPFFRELRRSAPNADITLVCMPECADMARLCPCLNRVIPLPKSWRQTNPGKWRFFSECSRFAAIQLRPLDADLAIVPRYDADYYHATFLAALSGAPVRIGYPARVTSTKRRMNPGYDRLLTHVIPPGPDPHELLRNLHLLRQIGGAVTSDALEFWHDSAALTHADSLLGASPRPRLAICVSTAEAKRNWPVDRFADVAARYLSATSGSVVLLGPPSDEPAARQLMQHLPPQSTARVLSLVGQTSLIQMAAVLRNCSHFLGGDSGPAHIAAACGCAVVTVGCHPQDGDPAGANSPVRFAPWTQHRAACMPATATPPCKHECDASQPHCILQVTVDHVWNALQSL